MYNVIEVCLYNHCCSGKVVSITQPVCAVVALGISMQCRCAILSVVCHTLQHFSTLSHKHQHFLKKVIELKMFVLSFSTTFVPSIFVLRRID